MATVLSTKLLPGKQKALLQEAGLVVEDYNAITIALLDKPLPKNLENLIFTSKNGVKAFLNQKPDIGNLKCFCVGNKTREQLENAGLKVLETASSATGLAQIITAHYSDLTFLFICGNRRRDELPGTLAKNQIGFSEWEGYETSLNIQKFNSAYDALLFFSPSGVQSYFAQNTASVAKAYCIGPTTAKEVEKHTNRFSISPTPSVEAVVALLLAEIKSKKEFNK